MEIGPSGRSTGYWENVIQGDGGHVAYSSLLCGGHECSPCFSSMVFPIDPQAEEAKSCMETFQ